MKAQRGSIVIISIIGLALVLIFGIVVFIAAMHKKPVTEQLSIRQSKLLKASASVKPTSQATSSASPAATTSAELNTSDELNSISQDLVTLNTNIDSEANQVLGIAISLEGN